MRLSLLVVASAFAASNQRSPVTYDKHPFAGESGGVFAPIRIVALDSQDGKVEENGVEYDNEISKYSATIKKALDAALEYVESAVRVIPATAPIALYPKCLAMFNDDPEQCAQYDDDRTCHYMRNAPDDHYASRRYCQSCLTDGTCTTCEMTPGGEGVEGDLIMYVTAAGMPSGCGGTTIATAANCGRDQYDRPIAGNINFCPKSMDPSVDGFDEAKMIKDLTLRTLRFMRSCTYSRCHLTMLHFGGSPMVPHITRETATEILLRLQTMSALALAAGRKP
jgi:hypothetical protein